MKICIIIAIVTFCFFFSSAFAQELTGVLVQDLMCDTIVLSASNDSDWDAVVYDAQPDSNFGNSVDIIAEAWTTSSNPIVLRSLFNFPLPALPSNAIISEARLQLKFNNTSGNFQGNSSYPGSPYPLSNDGTLYRIDQNWSSTAVTWNNQPSYTTTNSVAIPSTNSNTQDLDVIVTPLVQDMYTNSTSSFGFLFKMNTEVAYRAQIYSSSNHLDPNHHPKLILCYKFPENLNNTGGHNDILLNFKQRTNTIEIYNLTTDQKISHCTVLNTFGEEMPTEIFANTIKLKNNLSAGVYIIKLKIDGVWISKKIAISL